MSVQQKIDDLKTKITKVEAERSALNLEKYYLEKDNFEEIYVGKFWKKDNINSIIYSHCKGFTEEPFGNYGIFDYFTLSNENSTNYTNFTKDFQERSLFMFCEKEITTKEFEEAMEHFKNRFFEFIRITREVLIEKI